MNEIHLSSKKLIELMSDRKNIIGQGSYGIIIPYDEETLIKIYYKQIFDGFYYLDEEKLIEEIYSNKTICDSMMQHNTNYIDSLNRELKKLEVLKRIGLVKSAVYCDEYMIGVLLNYYRNYNNLGDIYCSLSTKERKSILNRVEQYLYFLMSNNIYPGDIKENNILLRKEDLDVKFVDLDDQETRYEEREYIERFPHIESCCIDKYNTMCKRLNI